MTQAVPAKFAHVVFRTRDLDRMVAWYETVLGAHVAMRNEFIAFLTYDDEHHRVAIVKDPRITADAPAFDHPGVEHVSYTYASLDDLIATYERLRAHGIEPYWTINHGPTTSLYYRDPDGNQVELQIDNFPDSETLHAWFRSGAFEANPIGVDIDVDDLIARHRAGTPTTELLRRP
jgi:catechol 2,3-dioxygenase-like lactoylglutathione lyase family enzyme